MPGKQDRSGEGRRNCTCNILQCSQRCILHLAFLCPPFYEFLPVFRISFQVNIVETLLCFEGCLTTLAVGNPGLCLLQMFHVFLLFLLYVFISKDICHLLLGFAVTFPCSIFFHFFLCNLFGLTLYSSSVHL